MARFSIPVLMLVISLVVFNMEATYGQTCDGGVTVGGVCYTVVLTRSTWSTAYDYCRRYNGHLASINNADVQNAVADLVKGKLSRERIITSLWIGARESLVSFNDRIWKWTRSGSVTGPQGCYFVGTTRDLPTEVTARDPVTCIDTCRTQGYRYAGVQSGNRCFCGNNNFGSSGTSANCNVRCTVTSTPIFWCGGNSESHIYDVTGSYAQWGYLQPNNMNQYQRCAVLDRTLSQYKFADETCSNTYPYICQINNRASCNGTDSNGWYFEGQVTRNCYYISNDEVNIHLSWFSAGERCRTLGGYLVEMPGTNMLQSNEHDELKQILQNSWTATSPTPSAGVKLWIGLTKSGWVWETGEAFEYSNWFPGEPNSVSQFCAMMNGSRDWMWTDEMCNTYSYFVCQGGELPTTTTTTTTTSTTTTTTSATTTSSGSNSNNPLATPVAGASTTNGLSNVEIVLLVVLLVVGIIAIIVLVLICIYYCNRSKRKVHSTNTYEKQVTPAESIGTSSLDSGTFIDINDKTDFYNGHGYQYKT